LEDVGLDGRILKWIFKKYDGMTFDWIDVTQDTEKLLD
jgi:hypothetical protein